MIVNPCEVWVNCDLGCVLLLEVPPETTVSELGKFVSLISTCPAANGVRRMATTYAIPDSSHLPSLDVVHTP